VKDLADKVGVKVNDIIKRMMAKQRMYTVNQFLDFDSAADVAKEFGVLVQKVSLEEEASDGDCRCPRAPLPVVTIGGVDHGKTSARRHPKTASPKKRRHHSIGATTSCTPGPIVFRHPHEAFTAIRPARRCDIVVLSARDGGDAADRRGLDQRRRVPDHRREQDQSRAPTRRSAAAGGSRLDPEAWAADDPVEVSAKNSARDTRGDICPGRGARLGDEQALPRHISQARPRRGLVATVLSGGRSVGDFFVACSPARCGHHNRSARPARGPPSTPVEVPVSAGRGILQVVSDERKGQIIAMRGARPGGLSAPRLNSRTSSRGQGRPTGLIVPRATSGSVRRSDALEKLSTEK
jgi:translation initiation factor IF-2